MRLEDFLKYGTVVIQCHNVPDADAVASGFALYRYLRSKGKEPRFVYGGDEEIRKSNLKLMVERLGIPVEHVSSVPEPELLVYVDCQPGERNTTPPLCRWTEGHAVAVIDHHEPSRKAGDTHVDPALEHIVSSYGSCSTVMWELLQDAGYSREDINADPDLATALYYGLFMDTGALQEISHPADKDMRDSLAFNRGLVTLLRNSNMSVDDLKLVARALERCEHHVERRYAVVEAEECDPNLLGVISDLMIEVEDVDTCVAFCMKPKGAKLSIRSCVLHSRADDLASYLCNAGGHAMKAGGFLPRSDPDPERAKAEIVRLLDEYFDGTDTYDAATDTPDLADMRVYRKNRVKMGYVPGGDLLRAEGEEGNARATVRMLEGDFEVELSPDIMIMVGVEHDIYPCKGSVFAERYQVLDEPYGPWDGLSGKKGYSPRIIDPVTGVGRPFIPFIRSCVSKDTSAVYAKKLTRRTKVFTLWDREKYITGIPGDWFVVRMDEASRTVMRDVYIVKEDIFERLYSPAPGEEKNED